MEVHIRNFTSAIGAPKLADHWAVFLSSTVFWFLLYEASKVVFPRIFRQSFARFNKVQCINWHSRVVSLVHAVMVTAMCIPWLGHPDLTGDPITVYSHDAARLWAIIGGYFVWDVYINARYIKIWGPPFLMHGCVGLFFCVMVFRPIMNPYGPYLVLNELSTPFLNMHWFMDKVGMAGSNLQLINGVLLLVTFFFCRLSYGMYWYIRLYAISLMVLNCLNIIWFYKMIHSVRSRFTPQMAPKAKTT
ncbi:hypothetical protein IWQ60_002842 [Tieghemiomyces parasiticus]|uniref:TLC domain-containing protein n=1 Tax=Tieghemiomyces parasiticus TaxID=78921 RepID=A0A9W8AEE1_9FUNG|nr:hypothetical protein IWQ60_002842 [Tieghemiomyces parasiticus]